MDMAAPRHVKTTCPYCGVGCGVIAEVQASFYMYVDPRYRMSWMGRIVAPAMLIAFLGISWAVTWLFAKPFELLFCFILFKVLAYESRRYRETAPDLPPSLRL